MRFVWGYLESPNQRLTEPAREEGKQGEIVGEGERIVLEGAREPYRAGGIQGESHYRSIQAGFVSRHIDKIRIVVCTESDL